MFQWEGAVDIHTMWSRDLSAVYQPTAAYNRMLSILQNDDISCSRVTLALDWRQSMKSIAMNIRLIV